MEKINEVKVVSNGFKEKFEQEVNLLLKEGYKVHGSIQTCFIENPMEKFINFTILMVK